MATATVVLTPTPSSAGRGEGIALSATVAPVLPATATPTGEVAIKDGSRTLRTVPLVAGVAAVTFVTLLSGARVLTAAYAGDGSYDPAVSDPVTVTISASARQRCLDRVYEELQGLSGLGFLGLDLKALDTTGLALPAAFVLARSFGQAETEPGNQHRVELPLMVVGYVRGAGATPDAVAIAREAFYARIENALMSESLQARFQTDLVAHNGEGAVDLLYEGIGQVDEGQVPPWGYFECLARATLHYTRGSL